MRFELIDDHSQLLGVFDDEHAALAAAEQLLADEPAAADEVALMAFDERDDDRAADTALTGSALVEAVRSKSVAAMGLTSQPQPQPR